MHHAQTPVRIVADDRENAGGVIAELRAREDVALEVRRLATGDFFVEDRFAVERKTPADFGRSVVDARLFKQAAALMQGTRRGVLILEGTGPDRRDGGVSREALQGALITVSVFYGLAVLRARQLFVLQGLPGIGPERAGRLLERFGSVQAVAAASAAELAAVDGLGETTAARIRWALEESAGAYEVSGFASRESRSNSTTA